LFFGLCAVPALATAQAAPEPDEPWRLVAPGCPVDEAERLSRALRAESVGVVEAFSIAVQSVSGTRPPTSGSLSPDPSAEDRPRFIRLRTTRCVRDAARVTVELGRGDEVWLRRSIELGDAPAADRMRIVALRTVDLLRQVRPGVTPASADRTNGEEPRHGPQTVRVASRLSKPPKSPSRAASGAPTNAGGPSVDQARPPSQPEPSAGTSATASMGASTGAAVRALAFGQVELGRAPRSFFAGPALELRVRSRSSRFGFIASPVALFARASDELGEVRLRLFKVELGLGIVLWRSASVALRAGGRLWLGYGRAKGDPVPGARGDVGDAVLTGATLAFGAEVEWNDHWLLHADLGVVGVTQGLTARAAGVPATAYRNALFLARVGIGWSR
jgi:hypothetical protein